MNLDDKQIAQIVNTVLAQLENGSASVSPSATDVSPGIFRSLDDAVAEAHKAQKQIRGPKSFRPSARPG